MKITESIVKNYGWLVTYTKFWIREFKTLTPMPVMARLDMWTRGFFSAAWYRYEFYRKENKPSEYVSDYQENLIASKINKKIVSIYVDDKVIFPLFFKNFCPVVENFAFINNGKLIPQSTTVVFHSFDDIWNYIKTSGDIIIKPIGGSRGGKVNVFKNNADSSYIEINGAVKDKEAFVTYAATLDFNIVCPMVYQADYSKRFYPSTTNTIRMLTMIDPDTNKAFIAHAVQRIGTKHSFPVDNFAVGGITVNIDIAAGRLGKGSYIIPTESSKTWYTNHPETNEQIEGSLIPNWEKIKETMLNVADSVSFLKIIGWDLIIVNNEKGFVLLEGNNGPCFKVHQLHGGFNKDPQIKKFMKHYKVI
jgi:Sugar-transfer associated ATP-grasp